MYLRRFVANVIILSAIFTGIAYIEVGRGLNPSSWLYLFGVIGCMAIAYFTEVVRVQQRQYGGWLIVVFVLVSLYVYRTGASGHTLAEIFRSTLVNVGTNGPTITETADRLKELYIVLGTAAFTLYGLFFIAVKQINMHNAIRLVTIGEGFGLVFLFAVPALMLHNSPWWRLGLMFSLNLSSLALFARELQPLPTDFGKDSPTVVAFWLDWINQRRAYSMFIFFSLCTLALWPVLGEEILVVTLGYILYSSTRAATFLYISTEIQIDALNYDNILRSLFMVHVSPKLEQQVNEAKQQRFRWWYAQSPASQHVLFRFANQPRKVPRTVWFKFSNRKDK